jgi:methyl-accepting chemotaxis protein
MTVILTYMGMIVMVVAVVVILLVFFLSREFARPITLISQVAERLSKGDLTVTVPEFNRLDEIGALAGAFHSMLESMKTQTGRLYEGIKILSGSATEISTAITQMVTSTAETATSVNQTTATLEEVKQAAMVANDNAMNVARISQQAVAISTEGKKATEATIQGISLIRDQMESVGETVVRLSEHSVAIEQIIASVQDLADQSNLLAVNASIEAARAGEQGRGFAVVAQEIKGLADQSRESTLEVRSILEDVRRSVSAVVMATEQGNKAVDAGVRQSTKAEEAITSLSKVVETSSQAASIIEVSAEQQTAGIDQVALAMSTINKAMQDTLASTQQMEENAKKLEEFGNQLQIIVQTFKIG